MKIKKSLIVIIVISNLMFLLSIYYMFYYKETSFDVTKKADLNCESLQKITTDEGTWVWNDTTFDFYTDYKVELKTESEIQEFCSLVKNSKSKYIDNQKCKNWVNIYLEIDNKLEHRITLKHNFSDEIFFEYDNHTYEGKEMANFMQTKRKIN